MRQICSFRKFNKFQYESLFSCSNRTSRCYSTPDKQQALSNVTDNPQYPPIIGKFPPGHWSPFPERVAWRLHEEAERLKTIPNVKERLESMAGEEGSYMILCRACDHVPDTLLYKQYVTKSHIIEGTPGLHSSVHVDDEVTSVKSQIDDAILSHYEQDICIWSSKLITHSFLGNLISTITSKLSLTHNHLLYSQLDENVRIETFWKRTGYTKKGEKPNGENNLRVYGVSFGMIPIQYKDVADWQVRTELPLPEFLERENELCKGSSVKCPYNPSSFGQRAVHSRPISTSGHWIGDPCEWGQVSFYTMREKYDRYLAQYGEDRMKTQMKQMVMTAGFGSCVAQAYNQGFSYLNDITYPITTHTVAYNANGDFYICAYQLNTLALFKDDTANPYRNLAWITGPHKLYDVIEDGKLQGFNNNTLELLLKCFLLKPVDRGIDLRPYLPEEESPVNTKLFINHKGDPPIEKPKIGRFQYPRNAVYF